MQSQNTKKTSIHQFSIQSCAKLHFRTLIILNIFWRLNSICFCYSSFGIIFFYSNRTKESRVPGTCQLLDRLQVNDPFDTIASTLLPSIWSYISTAIFINGRVRRLGRRPGKKKFNHASCITRHPLSIYFSIFSAKNVTHQHGFERTTSCLPGRLTTNYAMVIRIY